MNDEQIKQRIKYLVEHGGIYDDPIATLQRQVKWAYVIGGIALVFHAIEAVRWMS